MNFVISFLVSGFLLISLSVSAQEKTTEKVVDSKFLIVSASLIASSILDAESTFAAKSNPYIRIKEGNPVMRPFINSGRGATYSFFGVVNTATLYLSYRMKKSPNPTLRKLWWLPPVAPTFSHGIGVAVNFRYAIH